MVSAFKLNYYRNRMHASGFSMITLALGASIWYSVDKTVNKILRVRYDKLSTASRAEEQSELPLAHCKPACRHGACTLTLKLIALTKPTSAAADWLRRPSHSPIRV